MLPLTKPTDGYLRLNFSGAAEVSGVAVAQSWDLTELPEYVRADPQFKRSILIFARPLTAGLLDVGATVAFSPAVGTPTELVLTVTAGAVVDELALDVWYLHSLLGAVTNESKLYFVAPPGGGGGAVTSVFTRVGAVVAVLGDYAASLVTNDSGVAGVTVANALDNLAAAIVPAPVTSVFGRVGVVAAALGDYTSSLVTNSSGVGGATVTDALNTLAGLIPAGPTKDTFFPADFNSNYSGAMNYRVRTIGATSSFNFDFRVPHDFNSIVSLVAIGAPNANFGATGAIDLDSDYGAAGESVENHTETQSLTALSGVQDVWQEFDVSGVFTALAAGDYCGFNLDHVSGIGTTVNYLGIRLRYT